MREPTLHLFIVKMNETDYDQYDSFVVATYAYDGSDVREIIERDRSLGGDTVDWEGGYTVTPVNPTEPGIVHEAFHWG